MSNTSGRTRKCLSIVWLSATRSRIGTFSLCLWFRDTTDFSPRTKHASPTGDQDGLGRSCTGRGGQNKAAQTECQGTEIGIVYPRFVCALSDLISPFALVIRNGQHRGPQSGSFAALIKNLGIGNCTLRSALSTIILPSPWEYTHRGDTLSNPFCCFRTCMLQYTKLVSA